MSHRHRFLPLILLTLSLTVSLGCSDERSTSDAKLDARLIQQRDAFVLQEEPEGAVSVMELREELQANSAESQPQPFVVVGKIGGVDKLWIKDRSSFVIADAAMLIELGEHKHEPGEECSHCAEKKKQLVHQGTASVRFQDNDGKLLPADSRQLFDLEEGQTIVVQGTARIDGLDNLVIVATGLYVRR